MLWRRIRAGRSRAADPAFDAELLSIQQAWAKVNYESPAGDARVQAFDALEKRAEAFTHQHPSRAEALIWEGIIESSYAGAKGGLGALGLCKEARGNLEAALKLDPNALDGSAYTSLGTLYYKVPGFPIGFGDDKKAGYAAAAGPQAEPERHRPELFLRRIPVRAGRLCEVAAVPRQGRPARRRDRVANSRTRAAATRSRRSPPGRKRR